MNAKLIVNNREFDVELSGEQLLALLPKKRTGYERVNVGEFYYTDGSDRLLFFNTETGEMLDDRYYYEEANYYADKTLAKNIARANKLMRKLRRFAVEHRISEIAWDKNAKNNVKYSIRGVYEEDGVFFQVFESTDSRDLGQIYFDTSEIAHFAISAFMDELIWYFTEFMDCLGVQQ